MASRDEIRRVSIFINGNDADLTFRQLQAGSRRLTNELANTTVGTEQFRERMLRLQEVNSVINDIRDDIRGVGGAFEEIKRIAEGVSIGTLVSKGIETAIDSIKEFIAGSEKAYDEAQRTQTQLAAAIKSTGGVAGESQEKLQQYQQALMDQTGIDDDVIAKGQEMLLIYTNIRGAIYEKAMPAIVDYTAAMNGGKVTMEGIQDSAKKLGVIINDPVAGFGRLKKAGVDLSETQKDQIKHFQDTNQLAKAQAIIIDELNKKFGGTAKAIADTDVGQLQKFETRLGNIQENVGGIITRLKGGMAEAFDPFLSWVEKVSNSPMAEKLQQEQTELNGLVSAIVVTNDNQAVRNSLINQLEQKYPDFIGHINAERVSNQMLTDQLTQVNDQYRQKIFIAANEDKIKDIQERRNKAIKEEGQARDHVAKASGLSAVELAKLNDEQIKNLAIRAVAQQKKANEDDDNPFGESDVAYHISAMEAVKKDADLIINGRKRIQESFKEEAELMSANAVYQDKVTKMELANIDQQIAAIKKRMQTEKDDAKAQDQQELERLNRKKNELNGVVEQPVSGPSTSDKSAAQQKAQAYKAQLEGVRSEFLKLAEEAKKGTVDDLDAQLKVVDNKYQVIVDKIKKLLSDPELKKLKAGDRKKITDSLNGDLDAIDGANGLRAQDKTTTTNAFNAKQAEKAKKAKEEDLKQASGKIDQIYGEGQNDLATAAQTDLNGVTSSDPKIAEAQRYSIQELYAKKSYQLEQDHLEAMKSLYKIFGKDTGEIDKKIADTTIKEAKRAADQKIKLDTEYKDAKKTLQQFEENTLSDGLKTLQSFLGKNTLAYKAAFIAEQAFAAAKVVMNTEAAIAAFAASVAILGPLGLPLLAAYTTTARISEGISLAAIAAQTITGLKGDSQTKGYADGGYSAVDGTPPSGWVKRPTLFTNSSSGRPFIAGEGYKSEYIISSQQLKDPVIANFVGMMEGIRGVRQFESGGYSAMTAPAGVGGSASMKTVMVDHSPRLDKIETSMQALTELVHKEASKSIVLNYQYFSREMQKVATIQYKADAK